MTKFGWFQFTLITLKVIGLLEVSWLKIMFPSWCLIIWCIISSYLQIRGKK